MSVRNEFQNGNRKVPTVKRPALKPRVSKKATCSGRSGRPAHLAGGVRRAGRTFRADAAEVCDLHQDLWEHVRLAGPSLSDVNFQPTMNLEN